MSTERILPTAGKKPAFPPNPKQAHATYRQIAVAPFHLQTYSPEQEVQRHAELFYLQKQIQGQTPMVLVLEDGEQVEGCIEWYDRNVLKLRGRSKTMVYKSAIKYMYKLGDAGQ
ncbi:MAG: RNA chaperone Hfq [Terracidiphilus sp.]|jgi:sRNA-binding regulator protein Hfq